MGQEYWDLWFGGGNPQFWQMLRLRPTMNGQQNIINALQRIYELSGGMKTEQGRGLALKLLRMNNMENYMPMLEKWQEFQASGGYSSFFDYSKEQLAQFERTNEALRSFENAIINARNEIITTLLDAGLEDALKTIVDWVKGFAKTLKDQGLWTAIRNPSYNIYRGRTNDNRSVEEYEAAQMSDWWKIGKEWSDWIPGAYVFNMAKRGLRYLFSDSLIDKTLDSVGGTTTTNNNGTTINNFNNNIDMAGRSPQEATETIVGLNNGQININAALHSVPLF